MYQAYDRINRISDHFLFHKQCDVSASRLKWCNLSQTTRTVKSDEDAQTSSSDVDLLSIALSGLSSSGLFSKINLQLKSPINSMRQLKGCPPIKELWQLWQDMHLSPRAGFNPGTGDISFTLAFPKIGQLEQCTVTPKQAIIWIGLGLVPNQSQLEERFSQIWNWHYAELQQVNGHHNVIWGRRKQELLANLCLKHFMTQTGISIVRKRSNLRLRHVDIVVENIKGWQIRDGLPLSDKRRLPFIYSPIYTSLNGYNPKQKTYSPEYFKVQKDVLVENMIRKFWLLVRKQRYFPEESLKSNVSKSLREYLHSGIRDDQANFRPQNVNFSMYLYGPPGRGKSAFIKVFVIAFRNLVQSHLEPNKKIDLVKLPLNSIQPGDLVNIAQVRGISDWSIERIIEQTICKNGIVVFHLEENPEDPELQKHLFSCMQTMLESLLSKYARYRSCLIYMVTSNYLPSSHASQYKWTQWTMLTLQPMSNTCQREWCVQVMEDAVREHALSNSIWKNVKIAMSINEVPPFSADMRQLEMWRMSVGFFISTHLTEQIQKQHLKLSPCDTLAVDLDLNPTQLKLTISFFVYIKAPTMSATRSLSNIILSPLILYSQNSYFFYHVDQPNPVLNQTGFTPTQQAHMQTIVSMVQARFIKPAVIVLTGSDKARDKYTSGIQSFLKVSLGENLKQITLIAKSLKDRETVLGTPKNPMQGGLYRFISCANKENTSAMIVVHVNTIGQFMLREFWESSDSKTHVAHIKKDGIIFIVSIATTSSISPQLQSRAHVIVECK